MNETKLIHCEACKHLVSNQAQLCPQCGHPIRTDSVITPPQNQKETILHGDILIMKMKSLARYQRHTCYYLLTFLTVIIFTVILASGLFDMSNSLLLDTIGNTIGVIFILYSFYGLFCAIMIAVHSIEGGDWAIFILLLICCGGFFGLLYANCKATALLRKNGFAVSFFGADSRQFESHQ